MNGNDFIFPKWTNRAPAVIVTSAVCGFALLVVYFNFFAAPDFLEAGYEPVQPVAFSHKVHAGNLGIDCRYCHANVERSPVAGIPATETCMNCHRFVRWDTPTIRPVTERWSENVPIRWTRVHRLPEYVYFSHQPHVRSGMECAACHGDVAQMDRVRVVVHPQSVVHSMVEFVDGSIIAQLSTPDMCLPIQYALTYPERLRSLVLVCTTPGGPHAVQPSSEVTTALVQGGEDPATVYRRNAWFLYGDDTRHHHPERIEEDLEARARIPTPPAGYLGQLQAVLGHDVWDGLPSIAAPTLVMHGEADILVPTENGRRIAARIPGAELRLVPGAGHMLQADAGDAVREAFLSFLSRHAAR